MRSSARQESGRAAIRCVQATLGWDEVRGQTVMQRTKESADDYRYFPEPDLPPLFITPEWVDEVRRTMPELPDARRDRLIGLGLSRYDASVIVAEKAVADYFEKTLAANAEPKKAANWVINELFARMNKAGLPGERIAEALVTPESLAALIRLVDEGRANNNAAKQILDAMYAEGGAPEVWLARLGLEQTQDTGLIAEVVERVLAASQAEVARYCAGEEKILKFLLGQVMREGKGKFPAAAVQEMLAAKLKERCE